MTDRLSHHRARMWRAYADARRALLGRGSAAPSAVATLGGDRTDPTAWTHATAMNHDRYRAAVEPLDGSVAVVCVSSRPQMLDRVIAHVVAQRRPPDEFVLVTNSDGYDDVDAERIVGALAGTCTTHVMRRPAEFSLGSCLNAGCDATESRFVAKFDDDDHYGSHYLADALRAHSYSGAGVVGKHTYYAYLEAVDRTVLRFPTHEFRYSATLAGGTLVIDRSRTGRIRFPDISLGEDRAFIRACHRRGVSTFSADRFNFTQVRARDNTWNMAESEFLIATTPVSCGLARDVIDI